MGNDECVKHMVELGTENSLAESEGGYENITVARPMGVCDLDFLHFIHSSIQPGDTPADCIHYTFTVHCVVLNICY